MSHAAFRDKHGLSVRLLADVDGEVCERYGVWQEREIDGDRRAGIVRSTFIIDRQGIIRHALYGVIANGHARKVLGLIEAMAPC
jgi:peroxiredoxin